MVTKNCCGIWLCQNRNIATVRCIFAHWSISLANKTRISIAGLVILGGHTKVPNPNINWRNAWEGSSEASAYGATNALVKIIFSYTGYVNAFGLVNEIQV